MANAGTTATFTKTRLRRDFANVACAKGVSPLTPVRCPPSLRRWAAKCQPVAGRGDATVNNEERKHGAAYKT